MPLTLKIKPTHFRCAMIWSVCIRCLNEKQSCFRLNYMSHSLLKYNKLSWFHFLSVSQLLAFVFCVNAIWILQSIQMTVFKYISLVIPWHGLCCNQVPYIIAFCYFLENLYRCKYFVYFYVTHLQFSILQHGIVLLLLRPLIDLTLKHSHKLYEIKFLATVWMDLVAFQWMVARHTNTLRKLKHNLRRCDTCNFSLFYLLTLNS